MAVVGLCLSNSWPTVKYGSAATSLQLFMRITPFESVWSRHTWYVSAPHFQWVVGTLNNQHSLFNKPVQTRRNWAFEKSGSAAWRDFGKARFYDLIICICKSLANILLSGELNRTTKCCYEELRGSRNKTKTTSIPHTQNSQAKWISSVVVERA
jgi:hypothetical protein